MHLMDYDYVIFLIQITCFFLILWGSVICPLICTWLLWRNEGRMMIFVMDMSQPRKSELENSLWIKAKRMANTAAWSCALLGITWLTN